MRGRLGGGGGPGGSSSPQMIGDPAGNLQTGPPGSPSKEPICAAEKGVLEAYPGAAVYSPAHLAGWDQPRGPGAAALETGKPTRTLTATPT